MIRRFFSDERGNYALLTVVAIVPIMGGLALGVDYAEMCKQRQETLNALDAAGIATARRIVEGATDDRGQGLCQGLLRGQSRLGGAGQHHADGPAAAEQHRRRHAEADGRAQIQALFLPAFAKLIGKSSRTTTSISRQHPKSSLKNTLEVALVLDNSGSMDEIGTGSGKKRIDLLKEAAKQLVDTIAGQAAMMKQVSKPVQFALVPFSASVNVGPDNDDRDLDGSRTASRRSTTRISTGRRFTGANKKVAKAVDGITTRRAPAGATEERTRRSRASHFTTETSSIDTNRPADRSHRCRCQVGRGCVETQAATPLQHQRRTAVSTSDATAHHRPGDPVRADVCARRAWRCLDDVTGIQPRQLQRATTTGGTTDDDEHRSARPTRQKYCTKYFVVGPTTQTSPAERQARTTAAPRRRSRR